MNAPSSPFEIRKYGFNFLVYAMIIVVLAFVIFFVYKFTYGSEQLSTVLKVPGEIKANAGANNVSIPPIMGGGEYTVNFWIYITSYGSYRATQRKHLVEIGGGAFSTLVIALAATTPTLLVRMHTDSSGNSMSRAGILLDCSENALTGIGNSPTAGEITSVLANCSASRVRDDNLLNSRLRNNRLLASDVSKLFESYDVEESLINADDACDIKDIPLQKWVNICVVLNANVSEIYLDGKLVKSCVYANPFKVDNTGTTLKYLQGTPAGFDGYFSRLHVNNVASTPDDIYKTYLSGPTGKSPTNDPVSYIKYMFGA